MNAFVLSLITRVNIKIRVILLNKVSKDIRSKVGNSKLTYILCSIELQVFPDMSRFLSQTINLQTFLKSYNILRLLKIKTEMNCNIDVNIKAVYIINNKCSINFSVNINRKGNQGLLA